MAGCIAHRGPDDAASWADRSIALGFRRLAIIDLSAAGRQPMASADGRYVVVYNGEIYNHHTLREGLAANWRGHSDTEALVESIAARGFRATLDRLDGMFAIACWDTQRRELWLARDRFGEKPLYFGRQSGVFSFASELKAFKLLPNWSPEIDRAALTQFLRYAYVPAPRTAYVGWSKLIPGSWLRVQADGSLDGPHAYWSAAAGIAAAAPFAGDAAQAETELDRLLRAAAASRMEADVPLGAFLSGGIDSSAIVAALRAAGRPVKSFTIAFPGTRYDEAPHAAAVARHLGTEHTELAVSEADAVAIVPELPAIFDEPFADASAVPTLLLSRLTRQHVTVALTGDGGDELFAGYQRHMQAPAEWRRIAARSPGARRLSGAAGQLLPGRGRRVDRWRRRLARANYSAFPRLFRDSVTQWHDSDLRQAPPPDAFEANGFGSEFRSALALDTITYLPDDLLVKVDRCAMAASLETRAPFLSAEFAAFCWSLPEPLVQSKTLLRRVLYRYVPRELVDRPKQGFEAPVGPWLRGALKDWAADLLDPVRLRRHDLLDVDAVGQAWSEHASGRRNHTYRLWTVLMLQAWLAAEGRD
jgi:asparagine synthase (glutamine-hydrolysing)